MTKNINETIATYSAKDDRANIATSLDERGSDLLHKAMQARDGAAAGAREFVRYCMETLGWTPGHFIAPGSDHSAWGAEKPTKDKPHAAWEALKAEVRTGFPVAVQKLLAMPAGKERDATLAKGWKGLEPKGYAYWSKQANAVIGDMKRAALTVLREAEAEAVRALTTAAIADDAAQAALKENPGDSKLTAKAAAAQTTRGEAVAAAKAAGEAVKRYSPPKGASTPTTPEGKLQSALADAIKALEKIDGLDGFDIAEEIEHLRKMIKAAK